MGEVVWIWDRLPPLCEHRDIENIDGIGVGGLGGFVLCCGEARRDRPLKGGWSHSLPVGESGGVVDSLVWCYRVSAWCWGVGIVECNCCFCVVERFLEGCGEFEFVVTGVDGDE